MYNLKVETGDVDGGLVAIPLSSSMMYWPLRTPEDGRGFEKRIK